MTREAEERLLGGNRAPVAVDPGTAAPAAEAAQTR